MRGGLTDRWLEEYPNVYGDLSAGSGWNALTRDPEFGPDFVRRHPVEAPVGHRLLPAAMGVGKWLAATRKSALPRGRYPGSGSIACPRNTTPTLTYRNAMRLLGL